MIGLIKENLREKKMEAHYATDFIFNRGIRFINDNVKNGRNFALMLSIPDPHGPNDVRPPYDTMYNDMTFKLPDTGVAAYKKTPALPGWSSIHTDLEMVDEIVADVENDEKWQQGLRQYFGMVKLLDDSVGALMAFLKTTGQDRNTIVVFTSDHGDMMGEHGMYNKGKPYETSAGVPMIIRWPDGIAAGKIVKTTYTSPDFAPTILSLMGFDIDPYEFPFQGIDGSDELRDSVEFSSREQVRFTTDSKHAKWMAALDREFKLVLSNRDVPWLFDLKADPEEMINFYGAKDYERVTSRLQRELIRGMQKYKFSMVNESTFFVDRPFCYDSPDQIPALPTKVCIDLTKNPFKKKCNSILYGKLCAVTCGKCCEDSVGVIWHKKSLVKCTDIRIKKNLRDKDCRTKKMKEFCPVTCGTCKPHPSSKPSQSPIISASDFPSKSPSAGPTQHPSESPSDRQSDKPTYSRSVSPSLRLTPSPSVSLSQKPTPSPSVSSSQKPSDSLRPFNQPTPRPRSRPSVLPSTKPSKIPSSNSTDLPSVSPATSDHHSSIPTDLPSVSPTTSDHSSSSPTNIPGVSPTTTDHLSSEPSHTPTKHLSILPSENPTPQPSNHSSEMPTSKLSVSPSDEPSSLTTENPTAEPSNHRSETPTSETVSIIPSRSPSGKPNSRTTKNPTAEPIDHPSDTPTSEPSVSPNYLPSGIPSNTPSTLPIENPKAELSNYPSNNLTSEPSAIPSDEPSAYSSKIPSDNPTQKPSSMPNNIPTSNLNSEPSVYQRSKPIVGSSDELSRHPSSELSSDQLQS